MIKVHELECLEGDVVEIITIENKRFVGYVYEPALLIKIFDKIPFTDDHIIGLTAINLNDFDYSLNPFKILKTIESFIFRVEGVPMPFKEKEIKTILLLREAESLDENQEDEEGTVFDENTDEEVF